MLLLGKKSHLCIALKCLIPIQAHNTFFSKSLLKPTRSDVKSQHRFIMNRN